MTRLLMKIIILVEFVVVVQIVSIHGYILNRYPYYNSRIVKNPILQQNIITTTFITTNALNIIDNNNSNNNSAIIDDDDDDKTVNDNNTGRNQTFLFIPDTSNTIQDFITHLIHNEEYVGIDDGTTMIGYDNRNSNNRRGIYATSSFDIGDCILIVPFTSCIFINVNTTTTTNVDDENDDTTVTTIVEPTELDLGIQFWNDYYQHYYYHQHGMGSTNKNSTSSNSTNTDNPILDRWKVYFDCLPTLDKQQQQFTPTPDYWTDDAIDAVQITTFCNEMKQRKRDLLSYVTNYNKCNKYDPESNNKDIEDNVLYNQIQFASWLIRSRAFSIVTKKKKKKKLITISNNNDDTNVVSLQTRTVLIPYIDMINHAPAAPAAGSTTLEEDTDDSNITTIDDNQYSNVQLQVIDNGSDDISIFALMVIRPINMYGEILLQYGTGYETTLDFVSKYGFYDTSTTSYSNININDDNLLSSNTTLSNIHWNTSIEEDVRLLQTLQEQQSSLSSPSKASVSSSLSYMMEAIRLRLYLKQKHRFKRK